MKNTLLAAGILLFAAGCSVADIQPVKTSGSSTPPAKQTDNAPSRKTGAQDRVLQKLSMGNRGTSTQKKADFDRFKQELLNRIAKTPEIRKLYFWLHGPASADELLHGILTTRQYGKFTDTRAVIGLPGQVQWFRFPDDGYDLLVRDLSTMQWTNKLAEKYKQTGDVKYLDAWIGYWADFAEHWPKQYAAIRKVKEYRTRLPQNSIQWCDIPLYLGWRIQAFLQGLNAISRRSEAAGLIDSTKFAEILLHITEYEAGTAERQLATKEWLPNQRQHCAIQLFLLGSALPEFRDAPRWRETGLRNVLNSGILPDGSDMEQSFNYNADLPAKIQEMMTALRQLPPEEQLPLRKRLEEIYRNRCYFLHSLAKPNGALPIAGKNNTWRDYGKARQSMPGLSSSAEFFKGSNEARSAGLISDFSILPLSRQIRDFVYERRGTPPAFQSITFPFGGWSVLRSGWDKNALYAFLKSSRPGNGHWREGVNGIELDALGQAIIVNSGGEMYHPDPKMNEYWNSTAAHNSISVDGFGQKVKLDAKIPRVWETPLPNRFLTGREFDFIEGKYQGKYAGWNFNRDGANVTVFDRKPYETVIDDVTHNRAVILIKSAGIFLIRDTVNSLREHRFTQSWLFAPEFKPEFLRIHSDSVVTTRPGDSVNAAFYFYGIDALQFSTHCGIFRKDRILGWVAKLTDRKAWIFTPAVQLFTEWNSRGSKTLYTVIVPFRGENPVVSRKRLPDGFELTLKNGNTIRLSGGRLVSAGYELTDQGESGRGTVIPMKIPKQFQWKTTEKGVVPSYE